MKPPPTLACTTLYFVRSALILHTSSLAAHLTPLPPPLAAARRLIANADDAHSPRPPHPHSPPTSHPTLTLYASRRSHSSYIRNSFPNAPHVSHIYLSTYNARIYARPM
ncbi:hypothetical protein DFH06DRAFT_1245486 [Mycena polygramma]|nr:hypothetical protein DFH06DRAFT_1245486 [Mycena polygramma]